MAPQRSSPDRGAPAQDDPPLPADVRSWVALEVDGDTYQFDVTFLTSAWTCIYGDGCPGILEQPAPELEHGCCSHGAYFDGKKDRKRVLAHIERLEPEDWQLRDEAEAAGGPLTREDDGSWVTRTHDGACIMLNRPGWPGGAGCALHAAALRRGERPLDWKPYVCWQLPLRLDYHRDDNGHLTYLLREWKRRDWGEGGQEFHWWCTESSEAFRASEPVYVALRDELVALVGRPAYEALVAHLEAPVDRPVPVPGLKSRAGATDRQDL